MRWTTPARDTCYRKKRRRLAVPSYAVQSALQDFRGERDLDADNLLQKQQELAGWYECV
jgi:hypothetical protein